jgi:hypothetical protein
LVHDDDPHEEVEMSIAKIAVIGLALMFASAGVGAAFADWRGPNAGPPIDLDARKDDPNEEELSDDARDDDDTDGDGSRSPKQAAVAGDTNDSVGSDRRLGNAGESDSAPAPKPRTAADDTDSNSAPAPAPKPRTAADDTDSNSAPAPAPKPRTAADDTDSNSAPAPAPASAPAPAPAVDDTNGSYAAIGGSDDSDGGSGGDSD